MSDSQGYQQEWSAIHERRINAFGTDADKHQIEKRKQSAAQRPRQLVGLGLSGGGIRSAFYNLGFLQALSHRGFLRYVDYLCSVSGGGYLAGYLTSHAAGAGAQESGAASNSPNGFHADHSSQNPKKNGRLGSQWYLGRHPGTGMIDPCCLPGIGAYLSRTSLFALSFCVSLFVRILFYVGIVGVAATCVAMFYRTFDDPMFRVLCDTVLDLSYGDELAKAFMPSMVIGLLLLVSTLGLLVPHPDQLRHLSSRGFSGGADSGKPMLRQSFCAIVRSAPASLMWLFCLSLLCGVAIFIGNDITAVGSRSGNQFFLNHYAQYIILLAALSQLIAFLGRDRLFKSERNEKSHLPGMFQTMATASVVIFGLLAMVHLMGRENISKYTEHRDPYLVRGDVMSWRGLTQLAATITQQSREDVPELRDNVSDELRLESEWSQHTHNLFGNDMELRRARASNPPSPFESASNARDNSAFAKRVWFFLPQAYLCSLNKSLAGDVIREQAGNIEATWKSQSEFLTSFNPHLHSQQTFLFLCQFVPDAPKSTLNLAANASATQLRRDMNVNSTSPNDVLTALHKWVKSNSDWLPENERRTLTDQIAVMTNDQRAPETSAQDSSQENIATVSLPLTDRIRVATANRILLERFFPGIVQPRRLASTLIVPPHDQATRRTWLVTWMLLAAAGTLLGCISKLISAPRHFYRTQLNKHFLGWHGDTMLSDLNPQAVGLPLPIFLAARMRRVLYRGRYYVEQLPHAFTTTANGHDTRFADAVALSGAAVTPLMSGNIWLSLLLDFFGTGLGGWPVSRDRSGRSCASGLQRIRTWLKRNWSWIVGAAAAGVFFSGCSKNWIEAPELAVLYALGSFAAFLFPFWYREASFFKLLNPLLSPPSLNPPETDRDESQQNGEAGSSGSSHGHRPAYIADGGYYDYLGVTELLKRRCELMVVSDAGAHLNQDSFATLARICETARSELGVQFLDLDHEAPIDFRRLRQDKTEKGLVHQTFLALRVRYPELEKSDEGIPREGLLFYCQMGITDTDPVEILQIRNRFPSFPDEPTSNQFYTEEQVAAYRNLGYHIGKGLCSELHRWEDRLYKSTKYESTALPPMNGCSATPHVTLLPPYQQRWQSFCSRLESSVLGQYDFNSGRQPGLSIVKHRLLTAYRLACHREEFYKKDDVREEAIWPIPEFRFPSLRHECAALIRLSNNVSNSQDVERRAHQEQIVDRWLSMYESNADIRAAFRAAVLEDVNMLDSRADSWCRRLFESCFVRDAERATHFPSRWPAVLDVRAAAFLAGIAVASHEIHSGRPHETFQVGGREKLVSLCLDLAQQISRWLMPHKNHAPLTDHEHPVRTIDMIWPPGASQVKHDPKQLIAEVMGEVMELTSQIFFRFEHRTVASFSTCLMTSIAALTMGPSGKSAKSQRTESDNNVQLLTAQDTILKSLRRNDARSLSEALHALYRLSTSRQTDEKPAIPSRASNSEPSNSAGVTTSP